MGNYGRFLIKIFSEFKMAIYAISDLHLSLGAKNKSMEVFGRRWFDYINRLEANWRRVVREGDTVVVPGDISWAMTLGEALPDLFFIENLPGVKLIGKGNHDYYWSTAKKMQEFFAENNIKSIKLLHNNAYAVEGRIICGTRGWFEEEGGSDAKEAADKVLKREAMRLQMSIDEGKKLRGTLPEDASGEIAVFLHYPPLYGEYKCCEILNVLLAEEIQRCYYGHIHTNAENGAAEDFYGCELKCISADCLSFEPVLV